jgi:8-oxo-dGTP diphosphatase
MVKERFKVIVAVYLLIERDGKILLMRRANTGYMDGMYGFPAGHHDGGEDIKQAAAREAHEELGITIDPNDLDFAFLIHRPFASDGDRLDTYFSVKKFSGDLCNMEPEKCDDLNWYSIDALPEAAIDNVPLVLQARARGESFAIYHE